MAKASIQQLVDAAVKLQQTGRLAEAESCARQVLALQPDNASALHVLAVVMHQTNRNAEGLEIIQRAVARKSTEPEFRNSQGVMLMAARRSQEALEAFQRAIALHPTFPAALINMASLLLEMGRWEEAVGACRKAIVLQPRSVEAYAICGGAFFTGGRIDDSILMSQKALSFDPQSHQALGNLGNALMIQGRHDEAIEVYRRTVGFHPNSAGGFSNLGNALQQRARADEALLALVKAVQLDPNLADAHNNLGNVYKDLAQMDAACDEYVKAIALRPQMSTFHSNLVYAMWFCQGCDPRQVLAESQKWAAFIADPLTRASAPHNNDRSPNRRIKVGYLSADFRDHPVGRLISPLLSNHDKSKFEVILFSCVARPDPLSAKIYGWADRVLNTRDLSDDALAALVRQEKIDIFIDLTLHMGGSKMPVFARKPAPVQITYLAYCATTGMRAMDYCISDKNLDPPPAGSAALDTPSPFHSETVLRTPGCYWCYTASPEAPPVNALPAIHRGHATFGSLNSFTKLNPGVIQVWTQLMRNLPTSKMLLVVPGGPARQQEVAKIFADQGVTPDRLMMVGILPFAHYFQLFHQVDVALDPFPYNGGTTTMDALYMGVPLVTLAGGWATARAGVTLLKTVGKPEWIAETTEQYIQIVTDLVSDLPKLAQTRQNLRNQMATSPLMDGKHFAADLEATFQRAWQRWCGAGAT